MNGNWVLALSALCLSGCVVTTDARGPLQYESQAIERDASERVRVSLNMGAGDLKVSSGTQKLLQAYFNYNVPDLKPEVRYSTAGGMGDLQVTERFTRTAPDTITYEATMTDPQILTKPFKISVPLTLHTEKNFQIMEYECYAIKEGPTFTVGDKPDPQHGK